MLYVLLLSVLTVILTGNIAFADPEKEPTNRSVFVRVFGKFVEFDTQPFINRAGRTMVPVRFPAEALGADVSWCGDEQKVTIVNGEDTSTPDRKVEMWIGKNEYVMSHPDWTKPVTEVMDTSPYIVDRRTMVPLRFISEGLGFDVEWDNSKRIADVWDGGLEERPEREPLVDPKYLDKDDPDFLDRDFVDERYDNTLDSITVEGEYFKIKFERLPRGLMWEGGALAWYNDDFNMNQLGLYPLFSDPEINPGSVQKFHIPDRENLVDISINYAIVNMDNNLATGGISADYFIKDSIVVVTTRE